MLCFMKKSLTQDRRVISGREKMSMNCFIVWPWVLCRMVMVTLDSLYLNPNFTN